MSQLYLDLDGVLADFDTHAKSILKTNSTTEYENLHGAQAFWDGLRADPNFYYNLPVMPDAFELYHAVMHLRPIILTGIPSSWPDVVEQKKAWVRDFIDPTLQVITCYSRDKVKHMANPGDVLVDDLLKYRNLWIKGGGVFVHHTSAKNSIEILKGIKTL